VASIGDNGVEILDISDPANPAHVGSIIDDVNTELEAASDIYISGKYAYVAAGVDDGVEILEIPGIDAPVANIGSLAVDGLKVNNRADFNGDITVTGGFMVGPNGFMSQGAGSIYASSSDTLLLIKQNGTGDLLKLNSQGESNFVFTGAGLLGLGTETPDQLLHIYSASSDSAIHFETHVITSSVTSNPTSFSNNTSSGAVAWSNMNNVTSSDDNRATATLDNNSTYILMATSTGISVPAGAIIDGIEVKIEKSSTNNMVRDNLVSLIKENVIVGEDKSSGGSWPNGTDATSTYGSATDRWGEAWNADDINSSNFGVAVQAAHVFTSSPARIDQILITVHYTLETHWNLGIDKSDNHSFKLSSSSTLGTSDMLTVNTAGQLGLGTSSPDVLLHVGTSTPTYVNAYNDSFFSGSAEIDNLLYVNGTGSSTIAGSLEINDLLHIAGAGTSTISNNLNVQGTLKVGTGSVYITSNSIVFAGGATYGSSGDITLPAGGDFVINGNQLYLDSTTGYFGIGTTTPDAELLVDGTGRFDELCFGGSCISSWAGAGAIDGSGVGGQVAYWSDANTLTSELELSVTRGGTGRSSWTPSAIVIASTTGTDLAQIATGTNGQVLKIVNGVPTWSATSTGGVHPLLGTDHSDTNSGATPAQGDLIIRNGSNQWDRLAASTTGSLLTMSGGMPVWTSTTTLNINLDDTTGILSAVRGGTGLSSIDQGNILVGGAGNTMSATSSIFVDINGNIGIGTTAPKHLFTVAGQGDSRMFYDESKGAFRAGSADSSQWNDANVGNNSVAFGMNNIAVGVNSAVFGAGNTASGLGDSIFGVGNTSVARGVYNTVIGWDNHIYGGGPIAATAIGWGNVIDNSGILAMGKYVSASNTNSIAIGVGAVGKSVNNTANTIMFFMGSTSPVMTLNNDQYVGIGTTTPTSELTVYGNILVEAPANTDRYINFGTATSSDGYGLRASSTGQMQIKNLGGSWTNIGAGATALNDLNDVILTSVISGNIVSYNGSNWVNLATSSLGFATTSHTHSGFQALNTELTGLSSLSTNGITVRTSSGNYTGRTLATSSNIITIVNADGISGNPTFDINEANLTLDNIGGTLSNTKGGTGQNSSAWTGVVYVNGGTWGSEAELSVARGGTGKSTWTPSAIVIASTTGTDLAQIATGTNGQVLKIVNGVPTWSATSTGGAHPLLGTDHSDTDSGATVADGDLLIRNGGQWTTLANETDGDVLWLASGLPAWIATSSLGFADVGHAHAEYLIGSNNLSDLTSSSTARGNLGLDIGVDILAFDQGLSDIAGLATTSNLFMIADGATWATQDESTVRTTLGINNIYTYGINSQGSWGELWMSDGSGRGQWSATNTLGLLSLSAIDVGTEGYVSYYASGARQLTATSSIFISSDQNIGIGTTTPSADLVVVGTTTVTSQICLGGSCISNWGGAGAIDGTGVGGQVTYWSDANTLTSEAELSVTRGGTGKSTWTADALLIASSTGSDLTQIATGTNGEVLKIVNGMPTWSATSSLGLADIVHAHTDYLVKSSNLSDLTSSSSARNNLGLTDIYSNAINSTSTEGSVWTANPSGRGSWMSTSSLGIDIDDTKGTLSVVRGGTGLTSVSDQDLIIGGAGNTISTLAAGSEGEVLVIESGQLAWASTSPAAAHGILSVSHTNVKSTSTLERGDFLVVDSDGDWTRLELGPAGYILTSDGNDAIWATTTNITALGTIMQGTWQGDPIDIAYGGTGTSTVAGVREVFDLDENYEYGIRTATTAGMVWVSTGPGTRGEWMATSSLGISGGGYSMFVGTTTLTIDGDFATSTYTGYEAANARCAAEFSNSHFCRTYDMIVTIEKGDISLWGNDAMSAWIAEGPPGYTTNANDCNGWTNDSNVNTYGAFWLFNSNGGGAAWLVNCANVKPLACCSWQ